MNIIVANHRDYVGKATLAQLLTANGHLLGQHTHIFEISNSPVLSALIDAPITSLEPDYSESYSPQIPRYFDTWVKSILSETGSLTLIGGGLWDHFISWIGQRDSTLANITHLWLIIPVTSDRYSAVSAMNMIKEARKQSPTCHILVLKNEKDGPISPKTHQKLLKLVNKKQCILADMPVFNGNELSILNGHGVGLGSMQHLTNDQLCRYRLGKTNAQHFIERYPNWLKNSLSTFGGNLLKHIPQLADNFASTEQAYLQRYTDVAEAVEAGKQNSGYDHYVYHGKSEGRYFFTPEPEPTTTVTDTSTQEPVQNTAIAMPEEHHILDNLVELGREVHDSSDFNRSLHLWQQVLAHDSNTHAYEACRNIAQCHRSLSNSSEAYVWFAKALNLRPDIIDNSIELGRLAQAKGDYDAAINYWLNVTSNEQIADHKEAHIGLARSYRAKNNLAEARIWYEKLANSDTHNADHQVELGRISMGLGDYHAASSHWQHVLELNVAAYAKEAQQALALCSDDVRCSVDKMRQLLDTNELTSAYELMQKTLAAPIGNNRDVLNMAAHVALRNDFWQEAVRYWRAIIKADASDREPYIWIALQLTNHGVFDEAEDLFKQAGEHFSTDDDTALLDLARLARNAHLNTQAEKYFKLAFEKKHNPKMLEQIIIFWNEYGYFGKSWQLLHTLPEQYHTDITREALKQIQDTAKIFNIKAPTDGNWEAIVSDFTLPEMTFDVLLKKAQNTPTYDFVANRVAFVIGGLGGGGGERQAVNLARALSTDKNIPIESLAFHCTHLQHKGGNIDYVFFMPKLKETSVSVSQYLPADGSEPALPKGLEPLHDILDTLALKNGSYVKRFLRAQILSLYDVFSRERPEIVHAWFDEPCITTALAAIAAGVPKIILSWRSLPPTFRNLSEQQFERVKYMQNTYKVLANFNNIIFTANAQAGAKCYAQWTGVPLERISVILNGIDLADFQPSPRQHNYRSQLGIPQSAPVVGGVFRIEEVKQPFMWIEIATMVLKKVPDVHFVIVGDGALTKELAEKARHLDIAERLHLPGRSADIASWYPVMDVIMMTSAVEGLPNAVIEGQLFGVPAVVHRVGGMAEALIDGETGFVVEAGDKDAFAEKLSFILGNHQWAENAGKKAMQFAHKAFSLAHMTKEMLKLYGIAYGPSHDT